MRIYIVDILATDQNGRDYTFQEIVKFSNSVTENERENKAIRQVKARIQHLWMVEAKGSISFP